MRCLLVSDSPLVSTGYGTQTALLAPALQSLGHEVAILCTFGHAGHQALWNGIPLLPPGRGAAYAQDVVRVYQDAWHPDIVMTLKDLWVTRPELYGPDVRHVPYFPVDSEPLPEEIRKRAAASFQPIVFSQFAQRLCAAAGLDVPYVPLMIDTSLFCPGDQRAARESLGLPQDRFIVGMVAANIGYPSRKCFPEHLAAFAQLRQRHPDSLLYLHTHPNEHGEYGGIPLGALAEHFGIEGAVRYQAPIDQLIGTPCETMPLVYRALDVLANVSAGEGFGLSLLEAQACGIPTITGDWTAQAEVGAGDYLVEREDSAPWWVPLLASYQRVPRIEAIAECLEMVYLDREAIRTEVAVRRTGALSYDVRTVTRDLWQPVLAEIEGRIKEAPS